MGRVKRYWPLLLAAGTIGASAAVLSLRYKVAPLPAPVPAITEPQLITQRLPIKRRDTLADLLDRAGLERNSMVEMIGAIEGVFDVRKFRAGAELTLARSWTGVLESVEYIIDPDHKLHVARFGGGYSAAVVEIPSVTRSVPVCGVLKSSLFESVAETGERAELAMEMAEIFAWDMDFYTDPREGDQFCLLVEKKEYDNGQPPTYKRILAARYVNEGTAYDAFVFPDENGKPQYYSSDGNSLQAAFLRSPLKFEARVTGHFSNSRFHPILKIRRPHLGTDYAAPSGSAVQSIAAGRVTFSGYSGQSGNLIRVQHANGYETMYMHLSRRLVSKGDRVEQGQRIGLVGATGLATGPHLDFRMRRNSNYVDFERLRVPRATKLTAKQMEEFTVSRDVYAALMGPRPVQGPMLASGTFVPATAPAAP